MTAGVAGNRLPLEDLAEAAIDKLVVEMTTHQHSDCAPLLILAENGGVARI
jgi:hypothetical protein